MREAIASGRISSEEDAVQQALSMWEGRERHRVELLGTLEIARTSLAQGKGRRITSEAELEEFTTGIKQRGAVTLAAQQTRP